MKRFLLFVVFAFFATLPATAQTQKPIRVKCGGGPVTDSLGQVWAADYGFNGGQISLTEGPVSGTPDPELFQGGRWGDTPPLTYTFPVANGAYHVNLYFAEGYPADEVVGARVFNVKMQGAVVFPKLDVFATSGANTALIKSAEINVTNGSIAIEFDNVSDHAKVAAIEITQGTPSPKLTMNFTHPDGTPVAGTLTYTMSNSLVKLGGSVALVNGQASCNIVSVPSTIGLAGQFQLNLSLQDTAGNLLWQVSMAMNPANLNFGAVQSSALNVVVEKM
jgi:hypothetical protein